MTLRLALLCAFLTACGKWTLGPFPDEPREQPEAPLPWGPSDDQFGAHKPAVDGGEAGAKP